MTGSLKTNCIPLIALNNGDKGKILSIGSNPKKKTIGKKTRFIKRLMEMGLTPGTEIEMVKTAPFKGPTEILVRGSRLALGRGMAEKIFIERTN